MSNDKCDLFFISKKLQSKFDVNERQNVHFIQFVQLNWRLRIFRFVNLRHCLGWLHYTATQKLKSNWIDSQLRAYFIQSTGIAIREICATKKVCIIDLATSNTIFNVVHIVYIVENEQFMQKGENFIFIFHLDHFNFLLNPQILYVCGGGQSTSMCVWFFSSSLHFFSYLSSSRELWRK